MLCVNHHFYLQASISSCSFDECSLVPLLFLPAQRKIFSWAGRNFSLRRDGFFLAFLFMFKEVFLAKKVYVLYG